MKNLLLAACMLFTTCSVFVVPNASNAQGFNMQAIQQQLSSTPAGQQLQQQMMQQALQQAAANPQLVSQMANSLSPSQQATLMQQALVIGQKLFTPAEQAKLTAFTASPEGASIASKLPQLAQQLAPVVLQMYASSTANVAPAAGTQKLKLNTQH